MIFFDERNPNKYKEIKKLLVPYMHEGVKKVKVGKGDGGYVVNLTHCATVLSYGIGSDPEGVSFETSMLDFGCRVDMYDGSIEEFPLDLKEFGGISNFYSEYLTPYNFKDHVEKIKKDSYCLEPFNAVLKMDIEGHEYDWLTDENLQILANNFGQFTVEVHSLIEEIPEDWKVEPQLLAAKKNPEKVIKFFEKLNSQFDLWHIHANNHAPRYVDFPDSLELTYLNSNIYTDNCGVDYSNYPIKGLDEPNFEGREDYILDWWK